jgi:methylenetetrahydrofolate dehydrogenase (NADP+)/methenyltetrahydrofolate cyclohydrolase
MNHKLIDSRALATTAKAEIKQRVAILQELGWSHKLVSLDVAGVDATALYIRNQRRACNDVGIRFENRTYAADVTERELLAAIQSLNVDPRVTGIILQRPLPKHLNLNRLQNAIHPDKDVEGMNSANIGDIIYGGSGLGPCTARASVALLQSTGLDLLGLEVVVVGHSEIVGKLVKW